MVKTTKVKKTKSQLLEQFKRANKAYKVQILEKSGHTTSENYVRWLNRKPRVSSTFDFLKTLTTSKTKNK